MPLPTKGWGFPGGTIVVSGYTAQGDPGVGDLNVTNFTIKRGFEGPQLILEWDLPLATFDEIILVRTRYDYARTPTDGLVLQTGTFTSYVDTDLIGSEYFFYTIFVRRVDIFSVDLRSSRRKGIAFETGETLEHLLGCLAAVHKIFDRVELPLPTTSNPAEKTFQSSRIPEGEVFHLNEPENVGFGQLARFLRLFAIQLDSYAGELKYLEQFIADPINAGCDFLEALSGVVGWEFNAELTAKQQRREIEAAVALYKIKGTLKAVKRLSEAILEVPTEVEERHRNVLMSNQYRRRSLWRALCVLTNLGTCGDHLSYSWTNDRLANDRLDRVLVCATLPDKDTPLTKAQVNKLARILVDFLPATILGGAQVMDAICLETKDLSNETFDFFFDIFETDFEDEFTFMRGRASLRSGFSTRTSGNIRSGNSMSHSGVTENWFDIVTHT